MTLSDILPLSKASVKLLVFLTYSKKLEFPSRFKRKALEEGLRKFGYDISSSTLTELLKELTEKDMLKNPKRGVYSLNEEAYLFFKRIYK